MNNQSCEQILRTILWRTVNIDQEFPDNFHLYVLPKEDVDFVKAQLTKTDDDTESLLDSMAKLFIAFYFESIPAQIVDNLKSYPSTESAKEKSGEYFLSLAGLLHEVKMILADCAEVFTPYLLAYEEFMGAESTSSEDDLLGTFKNNVESAIQAIIRF